MTFIKKNALVIMGIIMGSIAGFLYYHYVGCSSGTCMITSKPFNSSAYGALMGGLVFSLFKKDKQPNKQNDRNN